MSLHAAAVAELTGWQPPDAEQAAFRRDFLDLLASDADATWRSAVPAHLTASAMIVDPERRAVLLALHGRVHRWLQVGGHCEPGDATLAAAALREATEESGIDGLTLLPRPCRLHRHPAPCRPGVVEEHFDVQYAIVAPPGAVPVVSEESDDVQWFPMATLPAEIPDDVRPLIEVAVARVRSA